MTGEEAGTLAKPRSPQKWKKQNPDMVENYTTWGTDLGRARRRATRRGPLYRLDAAHASPGCPYLYLAPAVALLLAGLRATRWSGSSTSRSASSAATRGPWIGLDNYRLVLEDPTFREAAKHSAILLLAVPIMLVDLGRRRGAAVRAAARLAGLPQRAVHPLHPRRARSSASSPATCSSSTASSTRFLARGRARAAGAGLDRQRATARWRRRCCRDHLARGRLRHRALPGAHAERSTRARWRPRASTARAGGSACAT